MEASIERPETPKVATTTTVAEEDSLGCKDSQDAIEAINSLAKDNQMLPQTQQQRADECSERSDQFKLDETTPISAQDKEAISHCDSESVMCSNTLETGNKDDCKTLPQINRLNDNPNVNADDDTEDNQTIKTDCHPQDRPLKDSQKPDVLNNNNDHSTGDEKEDANLNELEISTVHQSNQEQDLQPSPAVSEHSKSEQQTKQTLDNESQQQTTNESLEQHDMSSKLQADNISDSNPFGDEADDEEILEELEHKSEMLFKKCQQKDEEEIIEKTNQSKNKNDLESSLNPFGEFDSDEEGEPEVPARTKSPVKPIPPTKPANLLSKVSTSSQNSPKVQYPKDYNPFGDDEEDGEEEEDVSKSHNDSLNPFGEFDSDTDEVPQMQSPARPSPTPTPRTSLGTPNRLNTPVPVVNKSSPQSLRKSPKKARAPLPPTMNQSKVDQNNHDDKSSITSRTPTPTPRKSKATDGQQENHSPNPESVKTKKRSAPPIPAVKREAKTVSVEEIEKELDEIGDKLPELEKQRVELEEFLLSTQKALEKEAENDEEYKKKKQQFIDIAKSKCKLSQRQKELMYMKSEAKLEKQQMDIEFRLRTIMSKQDALKTEEDRNSEQEILKELMEVVENRNDIIENTIRDENKEIEEYIRIIAKVFPDEAVALTPSGLNGSKSDLRPSKSMSTSKLLKKKTITTLTTLKLKKKKNKDDKHSGKDNPEQGGNSGKAIDNQQEQETTDQGMTVQKNISNDNAEKKKKSHFSLGKNTLKKFTSKGKPSANKETEPDKNEGNTSDNTV